MNTKNKCAYYNYNNNSERKDPNFVPTFILCYILTEYCFSDMNNVDEVIQAISIGLVVANFLLNTNRFLRSIELCKECLLILKDTEGLKDKKISKSFYMRIYFMMWKTCSFIGDNTNAIKYGENILQIYHENGERLEEYDLNLELTKIYLQQCKCPEAIQLCEKALLISREIGDRKKEAYCQLNLGGMYQSVGKYEKAKESLEKSLSIQKEIEDRNLLAFTYSNLGVVFRSVGEYEKARKHLETSLAIYKEIGNRKGEAISYTNLGNVYASIGDYEKAREHLEQSLAIQKEISVHQSLEATSYLHLGKVYAAVGEYKKASDFWKKSLAISKKIGNKPTLAACYHELGARFNSLGKYGKANEYNKKALAIFMHIGDREGIARSCLNQGAVEHAVGNFIKAGEYCEKAIAISKEFGNGDVEAGGCLNLGCLLLIQAEHDRGEEYIKKALELSETVGDIAKQAKSLQVMAYFKVQQRKFKEALSYYISAIKINEEMRDSLRDKDQFKICFSDHNIRSYRDLSELLCAAGKPTEALFVLELSKARALADLMAAQYSVENQVSVNPRKRGVLEGIAGKDCSRTCMYVSYHIDSIYLWILKAGRVADFQRIKGNDIITQEGCSQRLEEFFDFRSFGILPEEICEDRSLHSSQRESKSREEGSHDCWRLGKESKDNQGPKMNLPLCYKLIIAPVVDLLEGPEVIIIPDRALYNIPFAALTDERGMYFSENFRIRMVPSLTTLKLLNESPSDFHCQTGALIVGNPDVGEVHFKGKLMNISRLPCAENEVKMIARKLGVEPLLGQQATKEAVLEAMNSAALIHLAAHGDSERGEIALAPSFHIPNGIPQEGLYLLTMTDISKVQLRAKLVVLSCCHSARGQTKAEGAVGIARAFLGSGARSVLVALWALNDEATEQFMTHFYDHLVAGESAGESLHKAMKWMRSEGYDVSQWAPRDI